MVMTHMSLGTLQGAATSAALVARVSLVSTIMAGNRARVSTPAGHHFSAYITITDWHQDPVQHAVLDLSE